MDLSDMYPPVPPSMDTTGMGSNGPVSELSLSPEIQEHIEALFNTRLSVAQQSLMQQFKKDYDQEYSQRYQEQLAQRQISFDKKMEYTCHNITIQEEQLLRNLQLIQTREAELARKEAALNEIS